MHLEMPMMREVHSVIQDEALRTLEDDTIDHWCQVVQSAPRSKEARFKLNAIAKTLKKLLRINNPTHKLEYSKEDKNLVRNLLVTMLHVLDL